MTHYLLAVHGDPTGPPPSPEALQHMVAAVQAFNGELEAAGAWVFAGGLQPPDQATVVHAAAGEVVLTNGPFATAAEHLGGFWVIEAADLDAALALAAKGSAACGQPVEVRPFQDEPDPD